MPATSQQQLKAMFAAKAGHSTLGIPAKVGADFVAATPSMKALPKKVTAFKKKRVIARRRKR